MPRLANETEPRVTIVIPVRDEVDSLSSLHAELRAAQKGTELAWEIVLVDDGSTDGSWRVIERLASEDPRVTGIRLRRNFGKAAALAAGLQAARGQRIVTLDADLQDDPAEIPRLLERLEDGYDVVSGWKQNRRDPWHKVAASRVFNTLVSALTGVRLHDHNCGLKCYRREVFDEVRLYGEMHRFIPVLASARGFRVGEMPVAHRERRFGHSKYGFTRLYKGLLDLLTVLFLTGFRHRPQHLLGGVGLVFALLGAAGLTYLACYWLAFHYLLEPTPGRTPLHDRPALIYSLGALLFGAQLLSIGFLAELFTAQHSRQHEPYSIAERTPEPKADWVAHEQRSA